MKIVFQGDSITDVGRNTNNGSQVSIGQGYALIADAFLSARYPGRYEFENRGVSGNRIVDVYARIKADVWNLQPDVLSVLIGINDVWHEQWGNGVDAVRFYNVYSMLVKDTLERFPLCKLILMEPFVLKGTATQENWQMFSAETRLRAEAVKRVAAENGVIFLPLQNVFDEALAKADASYWLRDGVHPTPAGHQLIAERWIDCFEQNCAGKQTQS